MAEDNPSDSKLCWPAPERNKGPILEVLRRVFPASGRVLEVASGSGQHAVYFAQHLPGLEFQPSDMQAENLASIRAWVREAGLPNVREPVRLDVLDDAWNVGDVAAIFNANMLHITPWACARAFFEGVGRHLVRGGVLVVYGPFRVGFAHTAPSNQAFDADLRLRNPDWGVRDVEAVQALASEQGLYLRDRVAMPANNFCLVFIRDQTGAG